MRKRTGLTRIDLAVAMACVALVLVNVPVISAGGRGRSKRQVCMANLKTLTAAWAMYADDHQGRIPCADVGNSHNIQPPATDSEFYGRGWVEWLHKWTPGVPCTDDDFDFQYNYLPVNKATDADWLHAIECGSLWTYIQNYNIYKCPSGDKGQFRTYTVSESMNTYPGLPAGAKPLTNFFITQITKPAEGIVFIDEGYPLTGAFYILYQEEAWSYDPAPIHHNNGTTFSFADGHTEYWKWVDNRTMEYRGGQSKVPSLCNQDLYRLQKGTWGKLGYTPSCTPEY